MKYLHHSTLRFLLRVVQNRTEEFSISTKQGIQLPEDARGPFELSNILMKKIILIFGGIYQG